MVVAAMVAATTDNATPHLRVHAWNRETRSGAEPICSIECKQCSVDVVDVASQRPPRLRVVLAVYAADDYAPPTGAGHFSVFFVRLSSVKTERSRGRERALDRIESI